MSMRRSYSYKVKLSAGAAARADRQLMLCRELYNAAIQHRRDCWQQRGVTISRFQQDAELKDVRVVRPEFAEIDAQVLGNVIRRVGLAFDAFFRRVKAGQKPGYPRFKGRHQFDSVTYRQTGWSLEGRYLTLRSVGRVKLHLSRPIDGTVKTVTLKRDRCGDWFATFSCDHVPARPLPETGASVGVDVGLTSFLATSDGEFVANPRPYRLAERRLSRAQRKRAKMKRGGTRYRKHSRTVAAIQRKTARVRRDFHFKAALDLVRRYDLIAIEDLNIRGLARMRLAKSVHDAGWGQFAAILTSKAEEAGRQVIAVDPRGTSQVCSRCGCEPEERKTLAVRVHDCPDCGLVLDRDVNAARNILTRAGAPPAASRPASKAAA